MNLVNELVTVVGKKNSHYQQSKIFTFPEGLSFR